MGNVIKVRMKRDGEAGLGGVMTHIIKAGTEGYIVDARPVVKDGQLTAEMGVFFPADGNLIVMEIDEVDVIENPMADAPQKEALAQIISNTVAIAFQLYEAGVDLRTVGFGKAPSEVDHTDEP